METNENHPGAQIFSQSCGCLLGGAVGDALGSPIRFLSQNEIRHLWGPDGITGYEISSGRLAKVSDNTQMALFTAEGLLRAQVRFETKGIGPIYSWVVSHAYQRWLLTQNIKLAGEVSADGWLFQVPELHHTRAPAQACVNALKSLQQRGEKARNRARRCEGVVRAAPVGLFSYRTLRNEGGAEKIFQLGCEMAWITHGHPDGYLPAGCLALVIACLLNDYKLAEAMECAVRVLRQQPSHEESLRLILRAQSIYRDESFSPAYATAQLGQGRLGHEALALALLFALSARDFDHGIQRAVNHSGNSGAIGSITGNILGALVGVASIDSDRWLASLELRAVIQRTAIDLVSWPWWDFESDEVWERYPGG